MKTLSKSTALALIAGTMMLGAAPMAFAQSSAPEAQRPAAETQRPGAHRMQLQRDRMPSHHRHRGGGAFGLGLFLHPDRGAEAIDVALVRLSHRIELTDEQTEMVEDLRSQALEAHAAYAETVAAARPERTRTDRPAPAEMFGFMVTEQTARAAALEEVAPAVTALLDSLTEDQLTQLRPDRRSGWQRGPGRERPAGSEEATPQS